MSFHDPVIDGANMEDTDLYEWQRRPGFSIFCPIALPDTEIVNQFYSARNLNGAVLPFVDTTHRWATFSSSALTTIANKTTSSQGYPSTVGNLTYYADGSPADLLMWDGTRTSVWGLAAPTVPPVATGMGFWQPDTVFALGDSILDSNGNVESVSAILIPNGAFETPASATTLALGGSIAAVWAFDPAYGGISFIEGYRHIQQNSGASATNTIAAGLVNAVTVGNTIIVSFGMGTANFIPSVSSVTDNLGNTYTQQASTHGSYSGGGSTYYSNQWVWTAPVTTGGSLVVTVVLSGGTFLEINLHEFSGISATASATANNFVVHPSSMTTGGVSFSGTQMVLSSLLLYSSGVGGVPAGYNTGAFAAVGNWQLADAYFGEATSASPTWTTPAGNGEGSGLTLSFPISSLATGYTPYLFLYDFNLSIPAGSTIVGIQVLIPKYNIGTGAVQDHSVKLVIGGSATGSEKATATVWNTASYGLEIYGGPTDLWGLTPTAVQLTTNGLSGFGLAISAAITDATGGSVIPEVGFNYPNQPTVTVYYKQAGGLGGPGISGQTEPAWPTNISTAVVDGGLFWTNYGPIQTWYPATGYQTPVVILDPNGNLQLSTYVANPIAAWDVGTGYALGSVVYFGGQYWVSIYNGTNTGVVPSVGYAKTGSSTTVPYWAVTSSPLVTGLVAPAWNTTRGGTTVDGSYTWTNIGQGVGLAFFGYEYVYGYRTVYGHLTTSSPFSNNTGAILGPLNASITAFSISTYVVTFFGNNNFLPGDVFKVQGLSIGTYLNDGIFTVASVTPSTIINLTSVAVNGTDVLTIVADNNLVAGQTVTFTGVGTATFLNGATVTVLSSGLSTTQFEANFTHGAYGPTTDTGLVNVNGSYSAVFTHGDVSLTLDSGSAVPMITEVTGLGTASPLCSALAAVTAVSITANIATITASNNLQPGLWVTLSGLTNAAFLNQQQVQVISVDQPVGTNNTQFQFYFATPDYTLTPDTGFVTFNAIEIYRTSDGGGSYLFTGAVTNPGAGIQWTFRDFTVDADLDELLVAPLSHQNDPPPGAPGSTIVATGSILAYWQGRLWLAVGNYVYFDAGPDCLNGLPEHSWPPGNRFQFAGPVIGLEPTSDGTGLMVYLADRIGAIYGGPETISFYNGDFLGNFGISSTNALFRDGSTIGQFTTQKQYFELMEKNKQEISEHIADYVAANFTAADTYATVHRDGMDVGVFLSNGVDRVLRYGSNIGAWSVPAFPVCGAGALRSIETSVGTYSLMLASPTGGVTAAIGPVNPASGITTGVGPAWVNPGHITAGNPTSYATVTFSGAAISQVLRASGYNAVLIPTTAVVQGIQLIITGKQSTLSNLSFTTSPTNSGQPGVTIRTFTLGTSNTTVPLGGPSDLWGMPWYSPDVWNSGGVSFDIVAINTAAGTPEVYISEVQLIVTYQNPGNYLYARDVNSWGDCGQFGANNGTPYAECNIVLGSITLSQPGARLIPLQHIVGYFDAAGTLNNGGPSQPDIWILPNEIKSTGSVGWIQLPEILPEPPTGQNYPSQTLLALRYPVNMMNSSLASQFIHHLQVKIQFEPENAPNTIKAISLMEDQTT